MRAKHRGGTFLFGGTIDEKSVARWNQDFSRFMVEVTDGETDTLKGVISVTVPCGDPCALSWPTWDHSWTVSDGNLVGHAG